MRDIIGIVFGIITGILFVIMVFKLDRLNYIRKIINNLFWEDIFFAERNNTKLCIKMLRVFTRFAQIMYLYCSMSFLIYGLIALEYSLFLYGIIIFIACPLMFRIVTYLQRKLWGIN